MLQYYAYYSCGGYKDFYLGNSEIDAISSYYVPLLAVWKKNNENGKNNRKIARAVALQKIEVVTDTETYGFPQEGGVLFSHGGYKAIYQTLSNGNSCFAARGLSNGAKDEENRDIPFNILITASGENDIEKLDKFAVNYFNDPASLDKKLATLFSYDPIVNGIKFDLAKLRETIESFNCEPYKLEHIIGSIIYLIVDTLEHLSITVKELELTKNLDFAIKDASGRIRNNLSLKSLSHEDPLPPILKQPSSDPEINLCQSSDSNVSKLEEVSHQNTEVQEEKVFESESGMTKWKDSNEPTATTKSFDEIEKTLLEAIESNNKLTKEQVSKLVALLESLQKSSENRADDFADKIQNLAVTVSSLSDQIASKTTDIQNQTTIKIQTDKKSLLICCSILIVGFLLGALIF